MNGKKSRKTFSLYFVNREKNLASTWHEFLSAERILSKLTIHLLPLDGKFWKGGTTQQYLQKRMEFTKKRERERKKKGNQKVESTLLFLAVQPPLLLGCWAEADKQLMSLQVSACSHVLYLSNEKTGRGKEKGRCAWQPKKRVPQPEPWSLNRTACQLPLLSRIWRTE